MKSYGRTTLSEFLGDLVVYRKLAPVDARLPSQAEARRALGMPDGRTPRKSELDYARLVAHILGAARALDAPGAKIERLLYLGDTQLHDGVTFTNLCQVGGWQGRALIVNEKPEALKISGEHHPIYLSNRWEGVFEFDQICRAQALTVDEHTAVILDLDKTALGGRGRNDKVIDGARVLAVHQTVAGALGKEFDPQSFQTAYEQFNQSRYHPFTADNQDYVAYVCLVLGSGLYRLEAVLEQINTGRLSTFEQFIAQVEQRKAEMNPGLRQIHESIFANVLAGDPTPFKAFRANEYRITTGRMGCCDDQAPVETLLETEILITQEVRQMALEWKGRGALIFGLSDKPDEAALPGAELAAQGALALHKVVTHAVGV
jgi:hypothetical protein